jgi:mersacidin/lichenicidin family type 2 lantibiotic
MSDVNVVRAWKDEEYRLSLPEAERSRLPDNPAGLIELAAGDLGAVAGGDGVTRGITHIDCTFGACSTLPAFCHRTMHNLM